MTCSCLDTARHIFEIRIGEGTPSIARRPFFQYSQAISSGRSKGVWHLKDFKFKSKNDIFMEDEHGRNCFLRGLYPVLSVKPG